MLLTLIKEEGRWKKAYIQPFKNIVVFGFGSFEEIMANKLRSEGYSVIQLSNYAQLRSSLTQTQVDLVAAKASNSLPLRLRREIFKITNYLLVTPLGNKINPTRDTVIDKAMEELAQLMPAADELSYIDDAVNFVTKWMAGIEGGLHEGHRLCQGCPQPKIMQRTLMVIEKLAKSLVFLAILGLNLLYWHL